MIAALLERFPVDHAVANAAHAAERRIASITNPANAEVRAAVLAAFVAEGVAESDLHGTLGYGYDDAARERYEALLARVLGVERVLARLSLVSGTHAIVTALAACVAPGSRLVVTTGRPYDTLHNALVAAPRSLAARGVDVCVVPFDAAGNPDLAAIAQACHAGCAAAFVQRSRGYGPRRSLSAAECGDIARVVKDAATGAAVLIDNCYGELVEAREPSAYGADLLMGSLIKTLGGGLAPGGGYVAGRADLVERVADHHYAPGLGAALGPTLGFGRAFVQGLFLAPLAIAEALAGLEFFAALFAELGYPVGPAPGATRVDIVQAIRLGDTERLLTFARGLQAAMPLNARFRPEPGAVPGYAEPVIMSAGAFVAGATIELSCDAPLRAPYEVYVQGGALREHVALGALCAADALARGGLLRPANREVQSKV